ncbi:MAG: hypothetical protein AB7S99_17890, partial [Pseudodonghicola sp.]
MGLDPADQILLDSQKAGDEAIETFKSDVERQAFDQLRQSAGQLVTDPRLKQYLHAAETLEASASSVAGSIMTATSLYQDLNRSMKLFEQSPHYNVKYNSEFDQAGSLEIGASRAWYDAALEIKQRADGLQAALSVVSTLLGLFPPTALAGAGLGFISVLLGEINDMINVALPEISSKAQTAHDKIQSFVDMPKGQKAAAGYFVDEFAHGSHSSGGVSQSRSSSPDNPGLSDPIVIDLDGDGVELTQMNAPLVFFDRQGNGIATSTGWVDPDDGLLARDLDGDGAINTQAELFGNDTVNAFDDLEQYDDDGNGRIDANDAIWSDLVVWRDLNQDGKSTPDELFSLDDLGKAEQ